MAWLRMMGAESVAYHRETIIGRGDDHPGQALEYYASRGETPLEWGGSGSEVLGLEGNVTDAQYDAIYGPGGAVDPTTGERLVRSKRPGMELVVSAQKSLAELGVLGRAEHMHAIMDAERDATIGYLDDLTRRMGGRRSRARVSAETAGLIYATARHATSRAGDPSPHDHVLLANAVEMHDDQGGYKAADTAVWRDHVQAATAVGRMASARVAVELGYGIVADPGPSGRLGHWAISGFPKEALDLHSKRAAEIDAAVAERGYDTYQARQVAARQTRRAKRHEAVDDLMPRWRGELEAAGFPVAELSASVDQVAAERPRVRRRLEDNELAALIADTVAHDGPLATRKVFTRRNVVVVVAPKLFGLDPAELPRVVDRVLADREVIPLLGVPGASERAYTTAAVIGTEQAIAQLVAEQARRTDAPVVTRARVEAAVVAKEASAGHPLTAGQADAVGSMATSGRGIELVLGVAGAGKTTALDAVRAAFQTAGYEVIGTATSGQAARTLGREAGLAESRTLASLLWRLDHRQLALSRRHVVVLDEAGMTDDSGLLRLLTAAQEAQAKVLMVGDYRQLGAVGPGGSLEAVVQRYGSALHLLDENVRQHDPTEREALSHLRDGDIDAALDWYARKGRVVTGPTRDEVLDAVVAGWAEDATNLQDSVMLAWRRANVDELNRRGREAWAADGNLQGAELTAPGGRRYAKGDLIVTLAPGADGELVTSERGVVDRVDPRAGRLVAVMDDGRRQAFAPEETSRERLAHGYALTVHRSQGLTLHSAHRLHDGGGRELAYVSMSRGRYANTVYGVADTLEQAVEDLGREWGSERRQRWAIDQGAPGRSHDAQPAARNRGVAAATRRARLEAERAAVEAAMPADPALELARVSRDVERLGQAKRDLRNGTAAYAGTPVGELARAARGASARARELAHHSTNSMSSAAQRRKNRRGAHTWERRAAEAEQQWEVEARQELATLDGRIRKLKTRERQLRGEVDARQQWMAKHPEAGRRLDRIEIQLKKVNAELAQGRNPRLVRELDRARVFERGKGLGR